AHGASAELSPDLRAAQTLKQMTPDEKFGLIRGYIPHLMRSPPKGIALGAGYVEGVPRLGIPPLTESDASLGVANLIGMMRPGDVATALPSGAAMAATFNPG